MVEQLALPLALPQVRTSVVVAVAARHQGTGDVFVAFTNTKGSCVVRRVAKPGTLPLSDREMADSATVQALREALQVGELPTVQRLGELHAMWAREVSAFWEGHGAAQEVAHEAMVVEAS